jgi:hypothetical protein
VRAFWFVFCYTMQMDTLAAATTEHTTLGTEALVHSFGLCERTALGPFEEPLNMISNMLFFMVAIALIRYYRSHPDLRGKWIWDLHVLTGLIMLIGVGSTVFHTVPSTTTELMDIIPIVVFIVLFFTSIIVRVGKTGVFQTIVCLLAFTGTSHFFVTQFPNALNDSIGYLSSMGALVMIAIYLHMKRRPSSHQFLLAALLGVISLFFRSVDNSACEVLSTGTHFLWHTLNAALIYVVMKQLIRNVNREARIERVQRAKGL